MKLPTAGETFDERYRVEKTLGEGAFGAVYLATDVREQRSVALKILKPDPLTGYEPTLRARFQREGRILARLRNPHTVELIDRGETAGGLMYLAFEWVRGEDLSEVLQRVGRLDPAATVHVARQVLQALREAHESGVLHRDLKPRNIRVFAQDGDALTVKVLDFGLARSTESGHPSITATGELVGTPRYMAPEQLLDRPLTPATDIYCLGIVMLEMLVGSEALGGNSWADQVERLRSGHVFSMPELDRVGRDLVSIVLKMTSLDPDQRFRSAAEVIAALDAAPAEPEPEPEPEAGQDTRADEADDQTRRLMIIAVSLIIAIAIVLSIVVAVIVSSDREPEPVARQPAVITSLEGRAELLVGAADTSASPTAPVDGGAPEVGVAAPAVDGCGKPPPFEGLGVLRGEGAISSASWLTYLPEQYDPERRHPLLVFLHPLGRTAREQFDYTGWRELADRERFVVILPGDGRAPWGRADAEHAAEVTAIVEHTAQQLCLDATRAFVVGQGRGGHVAEALTCAEWTTAVATYAYRPAEGDRFCEDAPQKPNLLFVATKSRHNPLEGGRSCTNVRRYSAAHFEKMWRQRNACGEKRRQVFEHAGSECFTYDCQTAFEICYLDGGHTWPGAPARERIFDLLGCDGPPTEFPMIGERIWAFFEAAQPARPGR